LRWKKNGHGNGEGNGNEGNLGPGRMTPVMHIPRERLTIRFARSGGPGGQNVNKVETKVEIRFRVADADWIPPEVRERLVAREASRITRDGELLMTSSRFRTRERNLEDVLEKLEEALTRAATRPKRRRPTRPTAGSRARRSAAKRMRSERKRERSGGTWGE
jgi:ribosome-associated protein